MLLKLILHVIRTKNLLLIFYLIVKLMVTLMRRILTKVGKADKEVKVDRVAKADKEAKVEIMMMTMIIYSIERLEMMILFNNSENK